MPECERLENFIGAEQGRSRIPGPAVKLSRKCLHQSESMNKQLLEILVCPVTGLSLTVAQARDIESLNAAIGRGVVEYADGNLVRETVSELLITRDRTTGYRIDDEIPIMLPERGIMLAEVL